MTSIFVFHLTVGLYVHRKRFFFWSLTNHKFHNKLLSFKQLQMRISLFYHIAYYIFYFFLNFNDFQKVLLSEFSWKCLKQPTGYLTHLFAEIFNAKPLVFALENKYLLLETFKKKFFFGNFCIVSVVYYMFYTLVAYNKECVCQEKSTSTAQHCSL